MRIYDISLPLHSSLPVWPGDEPYRYTMHQKISEGASVNLGAISLSVHTGTHTDAPLHSEDHAESVSDVALDPYIGRAIVVDVSGLDRIRVADVAIEGLTGMPRLLLKTGAWTDLAQFPQQFPVMDADVPDFLHRHGIILVGVDVPSVDAFESTDLPIHRALNARGIRILESLCLADVPAGPYELIALPLKLLGADGAPVRAILRTLTPKNGQD